MKIYVGNALAMGMLDRDVQARRPGDSQGGPRVPTPITLAEAREAVAQPGVTLVPAVGHGDTAAIIAGALGLALPQVNDRITVRLSGNGQGRWEDCEIALIGAYTGPRLPEGCTTLPAGATLEWWIV